MNATYWAIFGGVVAVAAGFGIAISIVAAVEAMEDARIDPDPCDPETETA